MAVAVHAEPVALAKPQNCARNAELGISRSLSLYQNFDLHVSLRHFNCGICIIMAELTLAAVGLYPPLLRL